MGVDAVNTKSYSFILYFILFKEILLGKYRCIVVFVKLKMFRQEDNNEYDVSIIAYFCLFSYSKYEYLSYSQNFLFNISFLFS